MDGLKAVGILALLLLNLAPVGAEELTEGLAVFPIRAPGIKLAPEKLADLGEYLATLLAQRGQPVVKPQDVRARLGARSTQELPCRDPGCRAELARVLGVSRFADVQILRLGDECKLLVQLYDPNGAALQGAAVARGSCEEGGLTMSVEAAAERLLASTAGSLARASAAPAEMPYEPVLWGKETGRFSLNAVPWGRVWIDGKDTGKDTPLADHQIPAGRHLVTVVPTQGEPMNAVVEIWPDEVTSLVIRPWNDQELTAENSGLLLLNTIPWSEVGIDGQYIGMTPISRRVPPGRYNLQMTFAHGEVLREVVVVEKGKTTKLIRKAATVEDFRYQEGMGLLKIHTSPWSRVWVDGKDLGTATPVFSCQLPPGRHELALHFSSGGYVSEEVVIRVGETTRKIIREK